MSLIVWAGNRLSWIEGLGIVLLTAGAGLLVWQAADLKASQQVILWGLWLAGLAILLRRRWTGLLGPMFVYDLIRSSRRGRQVILRCVYALALLVMLYSAYREYRSRISLATVFPPGSYGKRVRLEVDPALVAQELARFAESFFLVFMEVQFATVFLLTPVFAAGAIAEEKDRRTLEFILATDLTDREIVLSKLASRLAQLALLVLTGLPILALTQFLGGVDPNLVLAGFAATGISMVSITSLSILNSVYCKKPRDAIILTYLLLVAYFGIAGLSLSLRGSITAWPVGSPVTVGQVKEWLNAGNLLDVLTKLSESQKRGELLNRVLPALLVPYTIFHAVVAVICTVWAVARLRVVAIKEAVIRPRIINKRYHRWIRPPIGRQPMMWKEIFIEPGLAFNRLGKIVVLLIVIASLVPALWIALGFWNKPSFIMADLSEAINKWVRVVGTLVACLTLLGVALRAASSISGERDKQTLDSLMTSPLRSKAIVWAKWWGSILSIRWAWLWLLFIWGLGVCTGGLNVSNLPWLMLGWCIFAGFFATLGLSFSAAQATTQRATMWTLATTCLLQGGPWFSCMFCGSPSALLYVTTPSLALEWLAFRESDIYSSYIVHGNPVGEFMMIVMGFACWAGAALFLWKITVSKFQASTNRDPALWDLDPRGEFLLKLRTRQKKETDLMKQTKRDQFEQR